MKNAINYSVIILVSLLLVQCNQKPTPIAGIWKMTEMDINGTVMQGTSLGNWMWEFNDEGGYLFNVSGAVEKGRYELTNAQLVLESVTVKGRPPQTYAVTLLDSTKLHLNAVGGENKTSLKFVKISGEEVGESD